MVFVRYGARLSSTDTPPEVSGRTISGNPRALGGSHGSIPGLDSLLRAVSLRSVSSIFPLVSVRVKPRYLLENGAEICGPRLAQNSVWTRLCMKAIVNRLRRLENAAAPAERERAAG